MKPIRIYFEGGPALRVSFGEFLQKAVPAAKLRLVAGRGRDQAIDDFVKGYGQHPGEFLMLLLDSEEPDEEELYVHLRAKKNWKILRHLNVKDPVC